MIEAILDVDVKVGDVVRAVNCPCCEPYPWFTVTEIIDTFELGGQTFVTVGYSGGMWNVLSHRYERKI